MNHANENNLDEIYHEFKANVEWFPHIRKDYLGRNIAAGNVIFDDGVIIIYKTYQRKQRLGFNELQEPVFATCGDVMLHQILNTQKGNGKAHQKISEFFTFINTRVFLSVRSENLRACNFYEKVGMKKVAETSWKNGTMPGTVYMMENGYDKNIHEDW